MTSKSKNLTIPAHESKCPDVVFDDKEQPMKSDVVNLFAQEDAVITEALQILAKRVTRQRDVVSSPNAVQSYLMLKMGERTREQFGVLFLDHSNAVIASEDLFFGSVSQCVVYPREIVASVLKHNAAAVILYHNHPSGNVDPSEADKRLTGTIKAALAVVDVRVMDHLIVAGAHSFSFAENGLI